MRNRLQFVAVVATLGLVAIPLPTEAAERVSLTNGYELLCNHHEQVGSLIRLYLGSSDSSSYIDRSPEDIAKIETIPDPPPSSSAAAPGNNAKLSPADLHEMLAEAGQQHNLDADLLASVVKAESNGDAHAVSRAGARGLMQLMPKTAAEQGVDDSFSPDENVRGGSAYLNDLLVKYHDNISLALAAYNAGPAAVDKYHGIPPYHETRTYIARVIHEFNRRVLAREALARQSGISSPGFEASPTR
ncbi:MAG: lytic transglycosylase domain-containing protein [Terracidiphilus sp.]